MNILGAVLHATIRVVLIAAASVALLRSELSPALKVLTFSLAALTVYFVLCVFIVIADFHRLHTALVLYAREIHRAVLAIQRGDDGKGRMVGGRVTPDYDDPVKPTWSDKYPSGDIAVFLAVWAFVIIAALLWWLWPYIVQALGHVH